MIALDPQIEIVSLLAEVPFAHAAPYSAAT